MNYIYETYLYKTYLYLWNLFLLKTFGLIKFVLLFSVIYYQQTKKKTSLTVLRCFIREFNTICSKLSLDSSFVINNIVWIICTYKKVTLVYADSIDNDLIKACLQNKTDPIMRFQLNLVTYAGP